MSCCTCSHPIEDHEPECMVHDCPCMHFEVLDDDE